MWCNIVEDCINIVIVNLDLAGDLVGLYLNLYPYLTNMFSATMLPACDIHFMCFSLWNNVMVLHAGKDHVLVLASSSSDKKVKLWASPSLQSSWTAILVQTNQALACTCTPWQLNYAQEMLQKFADLVASSGSFVCQLHKGCLVCCLLSEWENRMIWNWY